MTYVIAFKKSRIIFPIFTSLDKEETLRIFNLFLRKVGNRKYRMIVDESEYKYAQILNKPYPELFRYEVGSTAFKKAGRHKIEKFKHLILYKKDD